MHQMFSKIFQGYTSIDAKGYLLYQHRNDGRSFEKHDLIFTNGHVVLHNACFVHKCEYNINIEICAFFKVVNILANIFTKATIKQ